MTTPTTSEGQDGASDGADNASLPDLYTPLTTDEIVARLEALSKRGKLAGFERGDGDGLCSVAAFGTPFDRRLVMLSSDDPSGVRRIAWRLRFRRLMPTIFAVMLLVSVWPGEPLTDSFLKTFLGFYNAWTQPETGWLRTWWWYYPLTILSIPFAWRGAIKKSRATSHADAQETIGKIASVIDAQPSPTSSN